MSELQDTTAQMIKWCKTRALPLLKQQRPEKAAEFEKDLADLERVRSTVNEELSVCFLGSSGVGKSTLINALVAGREMVVPSGGIGPLTAQALMVCYHEDPCFEVEYHPVNNLWQLIFALEQTYKARLRAEDLAVPESGEPAEISPIDAEDATEIAGSLTDQDSSAGESGALSQDCTAIGVRGPGQPQWNCRISSTV
jgi:ATPase subunit of ABC transporter with duplicated ATPase domains